MVRLVELKLEKGIQKGIFTIKTIKLRNEPVNRINKGFYLINFKSSVNNSNAFWAFSNAALLVDLDDF